MAKLFAVIMRLICDNREATAVPWYFLGVLNGKTYSKPR